MIIIGPFIFIINNYHGSAQETSTPEPETPPQDRLIERPATWPKETENMVHTVCNTPGCEWDGDYETEGRALQALAAHKSWCDKGKPFKKHPFGPR